MDRSFVSLVLPPDDLPADDSSWWYILRGSELLVIEDGAAPEIPRLSNLAELALAPLRHNVLGLLGGRICYAVEIAADAELPPGLASRGLRALYGAIPDEHFAIAGRAAQIVEWDRNHQFCGRCGSSTDYAPGERAKRCPACGLLSFPRLSPAVIVVVEREETVLLAHGRGFADGMYSCLAGFVEPGESLEEAVHREVYEEVGITLRDVRYFGSQPWPFPHSLMIGFTALYAGGELAIDGEEILEAGWFGPWELPRVPMKLSIARALIDAYVAKHRPPLDLP